jgi:Domain of unknown function (DUF4383)
MIKQHPPAATRRRSAGGLTGYVAARNYLIGGGVIYAVLWLYGLLIGDIAPANFVPMNMADDWLHFVLAVGMIGLGVLLGRDRRALR